MLYKVSQAITINKTNEILDANNNKEVQFWKEKDFIEKCKEFFIVDVDKEIYVTDHEILGCIDALKIIYVIIFENIKNKTTEELENLLINVPNKFKFSEKKEIVRNTEITNIRISNNAETNVYLISGKKQGCCKKFFCFCCS